MARKSDPAFSERVDIVMELLCHGSTTRQIVKYFSDKPELATGVKTIESYIAEAKKRLSGMSKPNREEEIGKARMRYEHLYSRSLAIQDFKTCKAIQDNICNLLGLSDVAVDDKTNTAQDALNAFLTEATSRPDAKAKQ